MGRTSTDPTDVPLATLPPQYVIFRVDESGKKQFMPNMICLSVQALSGANPRRALLAYLFDDSDPNAPFPTRFEQIWAASPTNPWVLRTDDRVLVQVTYDYKNFTSLFFGFAQAPELGYSGQSQQIQVTCYGQEIRLWDQPVLGSFWRGGDDANAGARIVTGLPARFNPVSARENRTKFNATPAGKDAPASKDDPDNTSYPLFTDPEVERDDVTLRSWTIGMAIRYLLWTTNAGQKYVQNPSTKNFDAKFGVVSDTNDDDDPGIRTSDIVLRDVDASNRPAIETIAELCHEHGYELRFILEDPSGGGLPTTRIGFYRLDGMFSGIAPKMLYHAPPGPLLPSLYNVGSLQLSRDIGRVVNSYRVETAPVRYEISVILGGGFVPKVGDEADTARKAFIRANWTQDTDTVTRNKYRLYHANECGDGIYDPKTQATSYKPIDLGPVLNVDADGNPLGVDNQHYVNRYRPALAKLISRDPTDQPIAPQLALSRNYTGPVGALWDGTGDWQPITGEWESCDDRLGIRVTAEDVEAWACGKYTGTKPQNAGPAIRGVKAVSNPSSDKTDLLRSAFVLRYTCVIEGDWGIDVLAPRQTISPTKFEVNRRVDARDAFLQEIVDKSSAAKTSDDANRDDTDDASAYAEACRAITETAPCSGSVVIPRLTDAYNIGDRISNIAGRNLSLQTSAGSQDGQPPRYPMVSAITWSLEGTISTTLSLTEHTNRPPSL